MQKILRAAIEAPTAGNMTLWSAIRVTDEAKKKRLSETCDNQPFIASAPLVLVFCADYKRWYDLFATLDLGEELRKPGEGDLDARNDGYDHCGRMPASSRQTRWAAARATSATSSSAATAAGNPRPAGVRQAGLHGGLRHSDGVSKDAQEARRALKRMISYLKTNISRAIPNRCGVCSKTVRISTAKSWNAGS